MRRSGILLHISSLPSKYGIGTFGEEAYRFVDFLKAANQTFWQILPLGPTSYGDSPYQTFSAFANNPYFIDLDILVTEKLLKKNEIKATIDHLEYINYEMLYQERFEVLKHAFKRFDQNHRGYQQFIKENKKWLEDYALFMAIKKHKKGISWLEWEEDIRLRKTDAVKRYQKLLKEEVEFFKFIQFKANEQWLNVKAYANANHIEIIGDMPIYVALDSSDVWSNPEFFQLDEERVPTHVAGVPPDNFSDDGQLWGNPLYNWSYLKEDQYSWWIERIKSATVLYDYIRIDHFIGFENYYSVPFQDQTARNGKWIKGPSYDLFKVIKKKLGNINIIAEDLGVVTPDVIKLLEQTGFPGMKLLQFGFDAKNESSFIPHLYDKHTVVYTGTHDNPATKTWLETLDETDLNYCLDYINHKGSKPVYSMIKATLATVSDTAIIPIQDYLNLGDEARMNTPSTLGNNWKWRLKRNALTKKLSQEIKYLSYLYGRNKEKNHEES